MSRWIALALLASMLSACGGGGGAPVPATQPSAAPAAKTATVTVNVSVPGAGSTSNARLRRVYSVASNTQGIEVNAYPAGTRTGALATSVADIAAGSGNCGASAANGTRACSFTITTPVAVAVDFVFTTYDVWTGSTVGGNPVASGVMPNQTIAAGSSPTIGVTLDSVVQSVSLALVPSTIHSIVSTPIVLDVYALDADNDVIVSPQYNDAKGAAQTLTVSLAPTLNGSLTFASTGTATATLTTPQAQGLTLNYNGQANDAGSPVTFSVTSSPTALAPSTSAGLAIVYPAFASGGSWADNNLTVTGGFHDGAVFTSGTLTPNFIYTTQNQAIDEYSFGTPGITQTSGSPAAGSYGGEALVGTTIYFLAQNGLYDVPVAALGSATAAPCSGGCPPANASGLGYDATNGYLYYTSGTNLVQYTILGGATATVNLGVVATGGVSVDASGNVWVVQTGSNASLLKVVPGSPFSTSTIATQSLSNGSQPFDVATAGNGDIVVSDKEYNELWVYNGSSFNSYSLPCCSGGTPWYLAADPAQPNVVWLDYVVCCQQIGLGRFDTSTGVVTTETYATGPSSGQPGALAVSNAGGIVMLYDGSGTLVEVKP